MNPLKNVALLCSLIIISHSCKTIKVYDLTDSPKYFLDNFNHPTSDSKEIFITSFNIKTETYLDKVLTTFDLLSKEIRFDILMLQEVDEVKVEALSKKYQLNYIYYPISQSDSGVNFGNAILSRFNISEEAKFILPNTKVNGRIRNATNCVLKIGSQKILVYCIHNETIVMTKRKRDEQLDILMQDIEKRISDYDGIIVGGDFNTICKKRIKKISRKMEMLRFEWATRNIGSTARQLGGLIKMPLDHFFVIGYEVINVKKFKVGKIGDHFPIVMKLQ